MGSHHKRYKTMKRETIEKRITEHLMTKKGELMKKYSEPLDWLKNSGNRRHTCRWHKSGRHLNLEDKTKNYTDMLKALGIDYTTGNDAPKGGAEGFYIELTPKGRRQVKEYQSYEEAKFGAENPFYHKNH